MNLIQENIQYEATRMTYWTRIYAKHEDQLLSTIIVCASKNYISDYFHLNTPINDVDLKNWMKKVLEDLQNEGEVLSKRKVNYKVYSLTDAGFKNGMEFLKTITP